MCPFIGYTAYCDNTNTIIIFVNDVKYQTKSNQIERLNEFKKYLMYYIVI